MAGLSPASAATRAVAAQLTFTRREDVVDDPTGRGQRRARTLDAAAARDPASYERRVCDAWDLAALAGEGPALREHGFARADLSPLPALQAALARVRDAGRLGDADAAEIRRRLLGRALTRTSTPRGLRVSAARSWSARGGRGRSPGDGPPGDRRCAPRPAAGRRAAKPRLPGPASGAPLWQSFCFAWNDLSMVHHGRGLRGRQQESDAHYRSLRRSCAWATQGQLAGEARPL